jgi:HTH-type transcriptional regulator, competence development regulator
MKLLFTNDWLRRKFASDPDEEPTAGGPSDRNVASAPAENVAVVGERNVVQLRIALGVLVRQLRLKEGLSIADLSTRAEISEEELRQVEHNPSYTARPRLIFQLSEYFNVPLAKLSQMSGSTHAVNRELYNTAVKYAAHADDMSTLTEEERRALDAFVAILAERAKG